MAKESKQYHSVIVNIILFIVLIFVLLLIGILVFPLFGGYMDDRPHVDGVFYHELEKMANPKDVQDSKNPTEDGWMHLGSGKIRIDESTKQIVDAPATQESKVLIKVPTNIKNLKWSEDYGPVGK